MAGSEIKLIYFDVTGRAEVCRLLLTAAGKEFNDMRINGQQWMEMKPNSPCGHLPILEVDGQQFGQSRAIASYLARELGLYGKNSIDGMRIDQTALVAEDFFVEWGEKFYFLKDDEKKQEGKKIIQEEVAPKYLGYFEKYLKVQGTGHIVGDSLNLGDIVVFDVCTGFLKPFVEPALEKFPLVKALVEQVGKNERIKEYVSKRK